MNRRVLAKETFTPIRLGITVFVTSAGVVAAVVTILFTSLGVTLKVVVLGSLVLLSACVGSFLVGHQAGRKKSVLSDKETLLVRTYPYSQHPEFFTNVERLVGMASNIILIGTGLNLLWQENILDLLIARARSRESRVIVCLGNNRSPHVLDRLVEEHMDENRAPFDRGGRNVRALVERLENAGDPDSFKVLLFEHYPTFAILIFDDQIFIYPYAYQVLGTSSPILQIKDNGSPEAEFFKAHAQRVLNDAVPARDVVKAQQNPGFYSSKWKSAAVFAIPEPDTDLYRAGSAVLGYDIWREAEISPSREHAYMRQYVGGAANYGFHLTLADALFFCNAAALERVRAELRLLAEQFAPICLTSFNLIDGFQSSEAAVLQVSDDSGTLEALHHELVGRVYSVAISSTFKAGRARKLLPQNETRARLMVKRYGTPYILAAFTPHFTLCSAMPTDPATRARILRDLNSSTSSAAEENCEINEIVMVVRDADEERWKVLERFRLRG